jgi:hypothetical protein
MPPTAYITGASAGLGAEFARQLATRGYNLVLVARRLERLQTLAAELRQKHTIHAEAFAADLANAADVARLAERLAADEDLALLVNNAGFGLTGPFSDSDVERQLAMLQVHVSAAMRLTRAALPGMVARRAGNIINVSSLAAFIPRGGSATYGATKAFLNSFSEALQMEVKDSGVRVQALCPGFTYTEFHDVREVAQNFKRSEIPRFFWQTAEAVVRASLENLGRERVIVIPGWRNHLLKFMSQNRLILSVLLAWRQARRRASKTM